MNITDNEKKFLREFIIKYNFSLKRSLKNRYLELYDKIIAATNFLPETANIRERLYCVLNDINSVVMCSYCHKNPVKFHNNQYKKYCSVSCGAIDTANNAIKLKIEKYGSTNNAAKAKQTRLEKYGSHHPKDFCEKLENTKLEKYGDKHYVNPNKAKQTKLEKYGDSNYNGFGTENFYNKMELKYKYKFYNNRDKFYKTISSFSNEKCENIKQKRIETNIKKYGTKYATQNENVKNKTISTCIQKYGVNSVLKLKKTRINFKLKLREKSYNQYILSDKEHTALFSLEEYINASEDTEFKFKCNKCGTIFNSFHINGMHKKCPKCNPELHGKSKMEIEVRNFIKAIIQSEDILSNTKKIIYPYELDIYIPSRKIAIEFDGLFWHTEKIGKDKNYHLYKTKECEKYGIQLIHIFENEWLYKQEIVKSRLKNIFGIYDNTCYARQCEVKEIDSTLSKYFQEANHIQGAVNSKVNLGLFYKNELVSLMTFSKPRFDKKHEWELVRFCNKLGWHIPGSASKLLTYFERNWKPNNIVSYADRRWSKGNLYEKLGFKLDHISPPDYWYFKYQGIIFESRFKYQKHKLMDKLEIFDPNKTEVQNMYANGYNRIFDCGNLVYIKM